jgi:hypothetical protein
VLVPASSLSPGDGCISNGHRVIIAAPGAYSFPPGSAWTVAGYDLDAQSLTGFGGTESVQPMPYWLTKMYGGGSWTASITQN